MWRPEALLLGHVEWKGAAGWSKHWRHTSHGCRETWELGRMLSAFQSVAQRSGVLIHHGAWAEDQQWWRVSAKWSDRPWEPAHPGVLWGKPLAFPGFSQRDADVAREHLEKRQRGFAVGTKRKPTVMTWQLEAIEGTKFMFNRCTGAEVNMVQSPQATPPHETPETWITPGRKEQNRG